MRRNDEIQKSLISHGKGLTDVTALLGGSTEVREDQWQGRNFVYPALRLMLTGNFPDYQGCAKGEVMFTWFVFSQETSSRQADHIAGILASHYNRKSFTSEGVRFFSTELVNLVPAFRQDERLWRSEVQVKAKVEG